MPKDPVRNVDRYKVRGGRMNEFDFLRKQTELAREQGEQEQGDKIPIPSEQSKADRIKQLLQKYGESVPGERKQEEPPQAAPKPKAVEVEKAVTARKTPKKKPATKAAKAVTKAAKAVKKSAKVVKKSTDKTPSRPAAKAASKSAGRKAAGKAAVKSPARGKASKLKSASKGKKAR